MSDIKKLSQHVINQIAAGEVVERPASVVKELIENAIDAGANKIDVIVVDGGLSKIEVKDNGKGISREDLPLTIERYATSKLSKTEDLESLLTYGFRGEALAAISSVSTTTIVSRKGEDAYELVTTNGSAPAITPSSRSQGTTVTIDNLFQSLPARQKFLKSAETEYRYILKMFTSFALLSGNIHVTLTHNGKEIYNLPISSESLFPKERVAALYAVDKNDLLKITHQEYGISVSGYLLHPRSLKATSKFFQTYINSRPVEDKGVFKATSQGLSGFVPDFYKPTAIVHISLAPNQVDSNVHPRKTEVSLINPFRVYSAVTHAVRAALQQGVVLVDKSYLQKNDSTVPQGATFSRNSWEQRQENAFQRLRGNQPEFLFDNAQANHYGEAPEPLMQDGISNRTTSESTDAIPEYIVSQARNSLSDATVSPVLGRYIIVGFIDELWMIDQHAAAERIRYEQLKKSYLAEVSLPQQHVLTPLSIQITAEEQVVLKKHHGLLKRLGFTNKLDDNRLLITSVPTFLQKADTEQLIRDTLAELLLHDETFLSPVIEDFTSSRSISHIIATMACHSSIRMNERISAQEAQSIVKNLLECDIPYACPHGRRVVWRLSKEEIDRQFMRT